MIGWPLTQARKRRIICLLWKQSALTFASTRAPFQS